MIWNEPVFFPLFCNYYNKYFSKEDICIYIGVRNNLCEFDKNIAQTCYKSGYQCDVLVHGDPYSGWNYDEFQIDFIKHAQKSLLEKYEYVLYADVDEIIYHPHGLDKFISLLDSDVAYCNGFELVQKLGEEPEIDPSRPIMEQRKYWYHSSLYSKPLLSRVPCNWNYGFHSIIGHDPRGCPSPNLHLIHLHKMDFETCLARNRSRFEKPESLDDTFGKVPGYQNRLGREDLKRFWGQSVDTGLPVDLVEIPEFIRNNVGI
jgi:hypothetical protein